MVILQILKQLSLKLYYALTLLRSSEPYEKKKYCHANRSIMCKWHIFTFWQTFTFQLFLIVQMCS